MVIYASLIAAILPLVVAGPGKNQLDHSQFAQSDIIRRDVAIVGGGASGVHAYFSLKDQGHSSIVIEKKGAIGGHAETYFDLATGTPINYGVQIFHNTSIVLNYFARFNVTLGGPSLGRGRSGNYDIRTGAHVNVTTYTQEESSAAISKYLEVISQWPDLERGMFLPDPVPEDLTLSFGDFAKKYGIEAIIPTLNVFNNGLGNPLTMPALEMIKGNGQGLLQGLGGGWRAPANGATTAIYTAAQPELLTDNNLLLNSEVVSSNRHAVNGTIQLVVKAPSGNKLIIAKKLLITIPPKLDYLRPFNPSRNETQVFSKFVNGGLYATIVNNTGIPSDLTITNTDPASWPNLPLPLPNIYSFMATRVPGLHISYYHTERGNASDPLPKETVKASIIEGVKTLQKANPSWATEQEPEVIVYASHSPYYHQVCAEEIKNGFYKKLYALQGQENTFWTGQAWRAPDSSSLWKFNEEIVLPQLTATL